MKNDIGDIIVIQTLHVPLLNASEQSLVTCLEVANKYTTAKVSF